MSNNIHIFAVSNLNKLNLNLEKMKKIISFIKEKKFLLSSIVLGLALVIVLFVKLSKEEDFWYDVYKDRMELKYWSSKDSLVTEIDKYIQATAPESSIDGLFLLNKCLEYNVDVVFVLAQATMESHFGTTGMAKRTNSVFNVGAYDGMSISGISNKHKYENPNLSIEPYLVLLNNRYLDGKSEADLLEKFVDKDGKRYASYPHYEKELMSIINKMNETTNINKTYALFMKYSN